jgi:hypothetical protein
LSECCDIPASKEITVKAVPSRVAIGENEGLGALALSPSACELWSVPVDFIEEMRQMRESSGAVTVDRPGHVVLVVVDAGRLIPAGREVDVGTEW